MQGTQTIDLIEIEQPQPSSLVQDPEQADAGPAQPAGTVIKQEWRRHPMDE